MASISKPVVSNQDGPHPRLIELVQRHRVNKSQRPVPDHTKRAFDQLCQWLGAAEQPLVLDACCGVGDSTRQLAALHSDCLLVGVDQSEDRLSRERSNLLPDNARMLRADLSALWPMMSAAGIKCAKQYLLYPNPWPKSVHVQRRWHAMPCFPDLIACGGNIELRSNWPLYIQEFALALDQYGISASTSQIAPEPEKALTAFEKKYSASGHQLWKLEADLSAAF